MKRPRRSGHGVTSHGNKKCLDADMGAGSLKLGCKPFAGGIPYYLKKKHGINMSSTMTEEERKLRMLADVFEQLKTDGMIPSTDPRQLRREDVQEFMAWMKIHVNERTGLGLDPVTQAKYLQYLDNFLRVFKNYVIRDMRDDDDVRWPKAARKRVRVIDEDDLPAIFAAAESIQGWRGSVARGMIALYLGTGVRPKELRLAHIEDLNMKKRTLFVRHPKGEGSWATPEAVSIILEEMIPYIERYLDERRQYLMSEGMSKAIPLFPNLYRGKGNFYSANAFNEIKCLVEKGSGVEFRLKDFRSTLTTMTGRMDLGLLNDMSAQLRHASIETTERSYWSAMEGLSGQRLREAWKGRKPLLPKKGFIRKDNDLLDGEVVDRSGFEPEAS